MPARQLAHLPFVSRPRLSVHLVLVLALGACASPSAPTGHPLAGAWRGVAAFSPASVAHRRTQAEVAITVADGGTLTGSLRMPDGEAATIDGDVSRDGALTVRFDRYIVEGRLHRVPRDRATGSGVQREGASEIGVVTLELARL